MKQQQSWVDETKLAAQGQWREILAALGIEVPANPHKHGSCPGCGGRDRFRFDDKDGKGTFICSGGGGEPIAGDGFQLLYHVRGWRFLEAARQVAGLLGIDPDTQQRLVPTQAEQISRRRVQVTRMLLAEQAEEAKRKRARQAMDEVFAGCLPLRQVPAVWTYLVQTRGIPEHYLDASADLLAHPAIGYFFKPARDVPSTLLGTFPALIGVCRSLAGDVVNLHRTYVSPDGRKLRLPNPRNARELLPARKLMTPPSDLHYSIRAYRPVNGRLGVAEGIETALSAAILNDLPCDSAIDSGKLIHYAPPADVHTLFIFADPDPAGRHGADSLRARLRIDRPDLEVAIVYPQKRGAGPGMDWNDLLLTGKRSTSAPVPPSRKNTP